jgi:hypothetical protein
MGTYGKLDCIARTSQLQRNLSFRREVGAKTQ